MDSYRFGVIGFGGRGRHHMKTAEALSNVEARCVAVADTREPTLEEKAKYGNRFYADYRDLIAEGTDLDYVIIASPDAAHAEQALAVLEAGIPVFLEKAVAISWEEAIRLYHTVVTKHMPLFIGYNLRRFPAALGLKQILDQGLIGKVQAVLIHINTGNRWAGSVVNYYDSPPYSDLMLGKLTHDIDTIQHCLGTEVKDVTALSTRNYWPVLREHDAFALGDVYSLSGLFKNDVLYTIHLTTTGQTMSVALSSMARKGKWKRCCIRAVPIHLLPQSPCGVWGRNRRRFPFLLYPRVGTAAQTRGFMPISSNGLRQSQPTRRSRFRF